MNQRLLGVGCLFAVLAVGSVAEAREWLAPDFFVDTVGPGTPLTWPTGRKPKDCRANIGKIMCVGMGFHDLSETTSMSRGCDQDDAKYVAFFEAIYDRLAPALQKMFCSVKVLHVEPHLESIAYAGMSYGGAEMGFRKSVIDEGLNLTTLMSWKEQLPYGGERDVYEPVSTLPSITQSSAQPPVQDLAFYVIAHEFGHLFDFANNINSITYTCNGRPSMVGCAAPKSFTALSWQSEHTVLQTQDFPGRSDICYYDCSNGPIARSEIPAIYAGLDRSNFITMYAATNMYDDFAESLAMTLLSRDPTATYVLSDGQGATYDGFEKLGSPQFATKKAYVEHFLARTDLQYP